MSLDITPVTPEGRQAIQRYGDGGFRIAGTRYTGSVLVMTEETMLWPVTQVAEINIDNLWPLFEKSAKPGIILIGCGPKFLTPPKELRLEMKEKGAILEWMDTGAACRTFNVLLTEERQVVAALIAVN
jgi:uncharacterized protein